MNDEIREKQNGKKKKENLTHFRESNPEHGMPSHCLKPGSHNVNVMLRQEVIQFSMGLVAGIEMISIPVTVAATNPLKLYDFLSQRYVVIIL